MLYQKRKGPLWVSLLAYLTIGQATVSAATDEGIQDSELVFGGFQDEETPESTSGAAAIEWGSDEPSAETSIAENWLWKPSRFTLEHTYGHYFGEPSDTLQNRSAFRVEYNKGFLEHYYLVIDNKTSHYWTEDHLNATDGSTENRLNNAYLQASFGETSINLGVQTISWGESLLSPITDVVSPRDNREFANFNLEELRLGQGMLTLNQYSSAGRFSLIFVPDPKFNRTPEQGSPYYFFDQFQFQKAEEKDSSHRHEYGFRWGRPIGNADISIMAASLMDNDYALSLMPGTNIFLQTEDRFDMYGSAFSLASGKFLWKGEFGAKLDKSLNNSSFQVVEKDLFDVYLGFEYTYNSTTSISMELVNQYIDDWTPDLQTAHHRKQGLLTLSKKLLNDDLTINFLSVYSGSPSGYIYLVTSDYKYDDRITFKLNLIYPSVSNNRSDLWSFRDQRQISVTAQYRF